QVLRDRTPLTAGRENIHEPVHDLAHDHRALVATWLARRDQGLDPLPLVVGQIARIAQLAAVIAGAVLGRPHGGALSSNQATTLESQQIHMIQLLSGQTLMLFISKEEGRRIIFGAAYMYKDDLKKDVSLKLSEFSDVHSTPQQRFFNLLCIAYGANREL